MECVAFFLCKDNFKDVHLPDMAIQLHTRTSKGLLLRLSYSHALVPLFKGMLLFRLETYRYSIAQYQAGMNSSVAITIATM